MEHLNLTHSWIGNLILLFFGTGYYFIATEEKFRLNKAIPAVFVGTLSFFLLGIYLYYTKGDLKLLNKEIKLLTLEIAEIFFFLFVAMTYIETLIERRVFEALRYKILSKKLTYKKIFWLTGLLAFFLSPIADNLTTALILSTVLITIEKKNENFLVPAGINIVVGANAGGAWSPFGDITTLMAWTAGKATVSEFLLLFPSSFFGWLLNAWLLSMFIPDGVPFFNPEMEKVKMKPGAKRIIGLGIFTIFIVVVGHHLFHLPPMWGMMLGLALLQLYSYNLSNRYNVKINVFKTMGKIENDTLLFFFGILSAVGALHFTGWLNYIVKMYEFAGATSTNILVGFISAIIDNVPVMNAILKSSPSMNVKQWLLVTLTAGIGGSLISFGSAAGVGVMGRMRGIYTFNAHLKYLWTILAGYILSILIWYLQFNLLEKF